MGAERKGGATIERRLEGGGTRAAIDQCDTGRGQRPANVPSILHSRQFIAIVWPFRQHCRCRSLPVIRSFSILVRCTGNALAYGRFHSSLVNVGGQASGVVHVARQSMGLSCDRLPGRRVDFVHVQSAAASVKVGISSGRRGREALQARRHRISSGGLRAHCLYVSADRRSCRPAGALRECSRRIAALSPSETA